MRSGRAEGSGSPAKETFVSGSGSGPFEMFFSILPRATFQKEYHEKMIEDV